MFVLVLEKIDESRKREFSLRNMYDYEMHTCYITNEYLIVHNE